MTSTPASLATLADLPDELYDEITDNLGNPKDRLTLLSLALVDKTWCGRSQRVLFRTVCDVLVSGVDLNTVFRRHIGFLRTIINNPTKLGPYVRTYVQNGLAIAPENSPLPPDGPNLKGVVLWESTLSALPALVNLEHLHIQPMDGYLAPQSLINVLMSCTFQLNSLILEPSADSETEFLDFLRTQHGLQRLRSNLSKLPGDVCPNLTSFSCAFEDMVEVTKDRSIIALAMSFDIEKATSCTLDLGGLRYLNLNILDNSQDQLCLLGPNLTVLELDVWKIGVIVSNEVPYWHTPNLRILAFMVYTDMRSRAAFRPALIKCFEQLPKLQYIVAKELVVPGIAGYRLSIIPGDGGVLALKSDVIYTELDTGMPWWTKYDNFQ